MAVVLQTYFWFTNSISKWSPKGNVYTGSCLTDPDKGCMGATTFEYRVWQEMIGEKDEEGKFVGETENKFFVESWYSLPWQPKIGKKRVGLEKKEYPPSEESLEAIKKDLEEREKKAADIKDESDAE